MKSSQRSVGSTTDRSWRRTRSKLAGGLPMSESSDDDDYHSVNTYSSARSRSKDDTAERENLSSSFQRRKKKSSASSTQIERIIDKYDHQLGECDAILKEHRKSGFSSKTGSIGSSFLDGLSPSERRRERKLKKLMGDFSPLSRSSLQSSSIHDDIISSSMLSHSDRLVRYDASSSIPDFKKRNIVNSISSRRSLRSVSSSIASFDQDMRQEKFPPKEHQAQVVLKIRPLTKQEELSKLCLLIIPPKLAKDRSSRRSVSSHSSHSSRLLESKHTIPNPTLVKINTTSGSKHFEFDRIYEPSQKNKEIFDDTVLPTMKQSMAQGCNVTFFSWGPKKTGKSQTIFGDDDLNIQNIDASPLKAVPPRPAFRNLESEDNFSGDSSTSSTATPIVNAKAKQRNNHGIILKTLKEVFQSLTHKVLSNLDPKDSPENTHSSFVSSCSTSLHSLDSTGKKPPAYQYKVALQVVDIRGQEVHDLLPVGADKSFKPASSGDIDDLSTCSHSVRTITSKLTDDGIFDHDSDKMSSLDCKYAKLDSYEQGLWYLSHAISARTALDEKHPRVHGHTVVTIFITQRTRIEKHRRKNSRETKYLMEVKRSKLRFVDIGERDLTGQAQSISSNEYNDDLIILRNVVYALSLREEKKIDESLIPYHESKLTSLLKDSLGGNHKTVFITCVSQSSLHQTETMHYLKLSRRAKMIKNKIVPNVRTLSRSKTSKVLLKSTKKELEQSMSNLDDKLAAMAKELQELKKETKKGVIGSSNKSAESNVPSQSEKAEKEVKETAKEAKENSSENAQPTLKLSPSEKGIAMVESSTPKLSNRVGDSNKEWFSEKIDRNSSPIAGPSENNQSADTEVQKNNEAVLQSESMEKVKREIVSSDDFIGTAAIITTVAETSEAQKDSKLESERVKGDTNGSYQTDLKQDNVSTSNAASADTVISAASSNVVSSLTPDLPKTSPNKSDKAGDSGVSDGLAEGLFVSNATATGVAVSAAAATSSAVAESTEAPKESKQVSQTDKGDESRENQTYLKGDKESIFETVAVGTIGLLDAVTAISSSDVMSTPTSDMPKTTHVKIEESIASITIVEGIETSHSLANKGKKANHTGVSESLAEGLLVSNAAVIGAVPTSSAATESIEAPKESKQVCNTNEADGSRKNKTYLKGEKESISETVAGGKNIAASALDVVSLPISELPGTTNNETEEFIDLSDNGVKEKKSIEDKALEKYNEAHDRGMQSKGERSGQTASQSTNSHASKGNDDDDPVSHRNFSAGDIRKNFSEQDDSKTPFKSKPKRRNNHSLFTPRSYATMPSISERDGFDSDDTGGSPHSLINSSKTRKLPPKHDSVNVSGDLLAISDFSEDDSLPRRRIMSSISDDDDFLSGVNRGHTPIKATDDVKTILKVDSSSFKFNSEFAQSLLHTEELHEMKSNIIDQGNGNKLESGEDGTKQETNEKKAQVVVENITEVKKMDISNENLEKEASICSGFSISSTHSDFGERRRSIFCNSRKLRISRGKDRNSNQSICSMDWVNKIFPEKKVSLQSLYTNQGTYPRFRGFPTFRAGYSLRRF